MNREYPPAHIVLQELLEQFFFIFYMLCGFTVLSVLLRFLLYYFSDREICPHFRIPSL